MWDKRYSEPGYVYGKYPNEFLESVTDRIPAGDVLCMAEGEGRNAVYLAERGYSVTAVDSSSVGLEKAKRLAAEREVDITTIVADLADYDIDRSRFQGIVSIFCHLPPVLRRAVHSRCVDGLAPEGIFVLEGFSPRQLRFDTGGPPTRELLMEMPEIKRELVGLRFDIAREVEREILEGRFHNGMAAVVQILAIKDSVRD